MTDLPEPLTPADCDLRGLKFMPLDVLQLRDSSLAAKAPGEAFRAAVMLWCAAWTQVPAGSLPNDEEELAHLCGYGRAPKEWKKVRTWALHKFVLCSDGRLYHPHIAQCALDSWERRGEWREKESNKNERQARWRQRVKLLSSMLRGIGVTPPKGATLETLERLLVDAGVDVSTSTGDDPVDEGEIAKTGKGTGKGTGTVVKDEEDAGAPAPVVDPPFPSDLISITDEIARIAGVRHVDPTLIIAHQALVKGWLDEGFDPQAEIIPAIQQSLASATEVIGSLRYFDKPIRQFKARKEAQSNGFEPAAPASSRRASTHPGGRTGAALDRVFGGLAQ